MTDSLLQTARGLFDSIDASAAASPRPPVSRATMQTLVDAGLYGLLVPEAAGGREVSLIDAVAVYAEISRADGSTGWCHFASDLAAAYFGAYLPDDGMATVFRGGVPLMAGQFAPNGTAVESDEGWVVRGAYSFGSGIAFADWAGAGILAAPADGSDALYLFACFPASDAALKGNWDVLGLEATASYDYAVTDVVVPTMHTFDFFAPTIHRGGAKYAMGVLPLTAAGHAGWALGVTRRALDELAAVATVTQRMGHATALAESERFLHSYGTLETRWSAGDALVRDVVRRAEHQVERDGVIDGLNANRIRQACAFVNQSGADIAREVYLLAGTQALRDGPLQRCFRDLHAGTQHFFAGPSATLDLARTLLSSGGDPS